VLTPDLIMSAFALIPARLIFLDNGRMIPAFPPH
jgi:hypothetical protein